MGEGLLSSWRAVFWNKCKTSPVSWSLLGDLSRMSCMVGVNACGMEVYLGVRGPISSFFLLDSSSLGGVAHPEPRVAMAPVRVEGRAGLGRGPVWLVWLGTDPGVDMVQVGLVGQVGHAWMALPEKASKKPVSK